MMQWTLELNDLLNQCVFECGYEFTDACRLLETRARTLRLLPDDVHALTADACQVQWMRINPVDDENEYDAYDDDDSDLQQQQQPEYDANNSSCDHSEAAAESERSGCDRVDDATEALDEQASAAPASVAPAASTLPPPAPRNAYPLCECAPLLELSISEAELDLLISSLPPSSSSVPVPEDDDGQSADAKQRQYHAGGAAAAPSEPSSEMQWVLSFLTNPDDAAQHDAEAKRLLETVDKREDDNYQFFLQELHDANLLLRSNTSDLTSLAKDAQSACECESLDSHAQAAPAVVVAPLQSSHKPTSSVQADEDGVSGDCTVGSDDDDRDDDDSDDSDDDWEVVRQSIKSQVVRPPVATITTRTTRTIAAAAAHGGDLGASPSALTRFARARISRGSENASTMNAQQQQQTRVALSREIGDLLQAHGEFQFPKRLFPHHNDALEQPEQ